MKRIKLSIFLFTFLLAGIVQANVNAQNNKSKDGVYSKVEIMPEYPGGVTALRTDIASEVKYPEDAKKKGIQGKVFVTFVVNENGKAEDAKIARGVDSTLDEEALRVINRLKTWEPGKEKGKAVKVQYTVPINFVLDKTKKSNNS